MSVYFKVYNNYVKYICFSQTMMSARQEHTDVTCMLPASILQALTRANVTLGTPAMDSPVQVINMSFQEENVEQKTFLFCVCVCMPLHIFSKNM